MCQKQELTSVSFSASTVIVPKVYVNSSPLPSLSSLTQISVIHGLNTQLLLAEHLQTAKVAG